MKVKYLIIFIACVILFHFILYFFNIDPFELYETKHKNEVENKQIDTSIKDLTDSLEQLKEINQ